MFLLTHTLFSTLARQADYLDPGSGSFLIQILIAALLGSLVFIRLQWSRIKSWFSKKDSTKEDDDE